MEPAEINLAASYFSNDTAAREFMESLRWPNGPICPHCGSATVYRLTPRENSPHPGRNGLLKCADCRKQLSVTLGTIFEDSHIPLCKWLLAIHLICSSKKGISSCQIQRSLGITYKSAWFLKHRIREAMKIEPLSTLLSGIVEADETYVGAQRPRIRGQSKLGRGTSKIPVLALVERNGRVQTKVIADVSARTLRAEIRACVDRNASRLMTDEFASYRSVGAEFERGHFTLSHGKGECARGEIHINTAESYFALVKRGVVGAWHHVSKKHLPRYLNEFSFRWDNRKVADGERTRLAVIQAEGKRLTYREPIGKLMGP